MKFDQPQTPMISVPFKAMCINDKNRPAEIPVEKWVVEEDWYTVVKVVQMSNGVLGFVLEEITLTEDNYPYKSFGAHRFGIPMETNGSEGVYFEQEPDQVWQEELLPS